jgi:uncharacterized protein YggE
MTGFSAAALLIALQATGWTIHAPAAPAAPQARASDQRIAAHPLGRGEVLLELAAMGQDSSAASLAAISVVISARGKSEAAARAQHDATLSRVREAAQGLGVAAADIEAGDVEAGPDPDGPMIDLTQPMRPLRPGASTELVEEVFSASSNVKLRIRAVDRADDIGEAVEKAGGTVSETQYSAEDTTAARQGARRKAIAQARADADTYAAALNMRVARIIRVTERTGTDLMTMMLTEMSGGEGRMREMFEAQEGRVPAVVFVGIDFVLAPR